MSGLSIFSDDIFLKIINCDNAVPVFNGTRYPPRMIHEVPYREDLRYNLTSLSPFECPIHKYKIDKIVKTL